MTVNKDAIQKLVEWAKENRSNERLENEVRSSSIYYTDSYNQKNIAAETFIKELGLEYIRPIPYNDVDVVYVDSCEVWFRVCGHLIPDFELVVTDNYDIDYFNKTSKPGTVETIHYGE